MVTRYIVEFYAGTQFGGWNKSTEIYWNFATASEAEEVIKGCKLRNPNWGYRVAPVELTEDEFYNQEVTRKLRRAADDILRQVVCDCGNYRHHGVGWMPKGSGEGLDVAVEVIRNPGDFNPKAVKEGFCDCHPIVRLLRAGTRYCLNCGRMEKYDV